MLCWVYYLSYKHPPQCTKEVLIFIMMEQKNEDLGGVRGGWCHPTHTYPIDESDPSRKQMARPELDMKWDTLWRVYKRLWQRCKGRVIPRDNTVPGSRGSQVMTTLRTERRKWGTVKCCRERCPWSDLQLMDTTSPRQVFLERFNTRASLSFSLTLGWVSPLIKSNQIPESMGTLWWIPDIPTCGTEKRGKERLIDLERDISHVHRRTLWEEMYWVRAG